VLVVGAGPIGLLTAVLLAERGIGVTIIDEQWRPAVHSYACALHPRSVRLLAQLGLGPELLAHGRRFETIGFYDGKTRQAELRLDEVEGAHPYLLVVPQNLLEALLEEKLQRRGVTVHWNHRLTGLRPQSTRVTASIEKLGGTAKGHIVPRWEWMVEKAYHTEAAWVVGADGHHSRVREGLGFKYESFGSRETFAVFEYASGKDSPDEIRVMMDDASTNVVWPLPSARCRWTFQMAGTEPAAEFPVKERRPLCVHDESLDQVIRSRFERLVSERAPWFAGDNRDLEWAVTVPFRRQLARLFGLGRCWLVGDAAHQTGPVGMQSMNAGFAEAARLAAALELALRRRTTTDPLGAYDIQCRAEWERLLGISASLTATDRATPWVRARAARLLPCVPGIGPELETLLGQLGLTLAGK
jgi:2-polyprenyl-6-methoxyphenol hydroxylase-like FAD-dependent oxidoreductase